MRGRFIVIEPSIKDEGGHYLQYGLSVLRAAREKGFALVLACHKDFPVKPIEDIEIVPAFTNTFWHRFEVAGRGRSFKARFFQRLLRLHSGVSRRFQAWWYFTNLYSIFGTVLGPFFSGKTVQRRLSWLRNKRYEFTTWLTRSTKAAAQPPDHSQAANESAITQMAADIVALGTRLNLTSSDHLLLATVSGAELEALLRAIQSKPELNAATWHLVFRRNLKRNPSVRLPEKDVETDLVTRALELFRKLTPSVKLYTDTEALSAEYNEAAGEPLFSTLPIPHVKGRESYERGAKPFVVTYLGDARAEKGFQLLPYVVSGVKNRLTSGEVRFRFQANFSSSADSFCAYARKELSAYPPEQVEIIPDAQPEEEYWNCIGGSHTVLIPYDPNNYSVRSSGIFAECLGMEVPVIVPAGTWMSRQIRLAERPRLASTFAKTGAVPFASLGACPLEPSRGIENPLERRWFVEWSMPRMLLTLQTPKDVAQLILRLEVANRWYVRARIDQRDGQGTLLKSFERLLEVTGSPESDELFALVDLERQVATVQITLHNFSIPDIESERSVQVAFLSKETALPPFGIGEVYFDSLDVPDLIDLIIDNFPIYEARLRAFGPEWRAFHSGAGLMKALGVGGKP